MRNLVSLLKSTEIRDNLTVTLPKLNATYSLKVTKLSTKGNTMSAILVNDFTITNEDRIQRKLKYELNDAILVPFRVLVNKGALLLNSYILPKNHFMSLTSRNFAWGI